MARAIQEHSGDSIRRDVAPVNILLFVTEVYSYSCSQLPHRNYLILCVTWVQRYSAHHCLFGIKKKRFTFCERKQSYVAYLHFTEMHGKRKKKSSIWFIFGGELALV